MRLIDADKAIEIWKDKDYIKFLSQEEKAKMLLDAIPTEHPQRKTGKWIANPYKVYGHSLNYECSECGKRIINFSDYCPNCGAEMEGVDEISD